MMPSALPDDAPDATTDADELTVQIDGGKGVPPRLLRVSRPFGAADARLVHVREWTGADWTGVPRDFEVAVDVLHAELERDLRARRQLSRELYAIRLWLDGRPI